MKKFWKIATPVIASVLVVCITITSITIFSKREKVAAKASFNGSSNVVAVNSKENPFEVWELVPSLDMAEFAYMYDETVNENWKDKLRSIPTAEKRKEYMNKELKDKWNGLFNSSSGTSNSDMAMSYEEYVEDYAVENEENWTMLELAGEEREILEAGKQGYSMQFDTSLGDYQLASFFAVAQWDQEKNQFKGNYKQNVSYYVYSDDMNQYYGISFAPYSVVQEDGSLSANGEELYVASKSWYIYSQNDYDAIKSAAPNAYVYKLSYEDIYAPYEFVGCISDESLTYDKIKEDTGSYYYTVEFSHVDNNAELSANTNYYRISNIRFLVDKQGNGVGEYGANAGAQFVEVTDGEEGYFVRLEDDCYEYVGTGNGTHRLVKGDGSLDNRVKVGKIYYKGGYSDNRILERDVFHQDRDSMSFHVTTMTPKEIDGYLANGSVPGMLYISGRSLLKEKAIEKGYDQGEPAVFSKDNDISWESARQILMLAKNPNIRLPIIVDQSLINKDEIANYGNENYTNLQRLVALLGSEQIFQTVGEEKGQVTVSDPFGMLDFNNWQTGNYNHQNGFYEGWSSDRICLKNWKGTAAEKKYVAHCTSESIHILVREMNGSNQMFKSHELVNGSTFVVGSDVTNLAITLYDNDGKVKSYNDYKALFEDNCKFYLEEVSTSGQSSTDQNTSTVKDVIQIDLNTTVDKITWSTLTYKTGSSDFGYVNNNVYVYPKNDWSDGKNTSSTPFIFKSFTTAKIAEGTTEELFLEHAQEKGFGEIAEYINEENLRREIENNESKNESGETTESTIKYKLFDREITKATVVEYIISYVSKEKRKWNSVINVLEIQPGKTQGDMPVLKKNTVKNWFSGKSYQVDKVNITYVTSAEFIGRIEDLSKYDMIYFGSDTYSFNKVDGKTVYNDSTNMDGLIYSSTGDIISFWVEESGNRYSGMLDSDYNSENKLITELAKVIEQATYATGPNTYRYSGNDITREKVRSVENYVKSGCPVLVDVSFYKDKKVSVNDELIDNCSYMYQLFEDIKGYENVLTYDNGTTDVTTLMKYFSIGKPELTVLPHDKINNVTIGETNQFDSVIDDTVYLDFKLTNQGAANSNTNFTVTLYLDMNADGKFSATQEALSPLDVKLTQNGNILSVLTRKNDQGEYENYYEIQPGEANMYRISYELPEGIIGLIPWKLVVAQNDNALRTVYKQGYFYNENKDTAPVIRILQINTKTTTTFNMQDSNKDGNKFKELINKVKEFKIEVVTVSATTYATGYNADPEHYFEKCVNGQEADMLIMGFGDSYSITDEKSMYGIIEFISSGKPVLFTHDTTSFNNDRYNTGRWGYQFNSKIRNLVGMDRYGILSSATLRKGVQIEGGTDDFNTVVTEAAENNLDIPYLPKSNKKTLAKQAQGFSYGFITHYLRANKSSQKKYLPYGSTVMGNSDSWTCSKVEQINEGQITNYPFAIDKNFSVASTHTQYYQLDFNEDADADGESDIVVWYTLSGSDQYDCSPRDVRNNYYIYTKGNVTYSGVGHSSIANQEMELKLYINTMVAAYNSGVKAPKLSIKDSSSDDADDLNMLYVSFDEILEQNKGEVAAPQKSIEQTWEESGESQKDKGKHSNSIYFKVTDKNIVKNLAAENGKVIETTFGVLTDMTAEQYENLSTEEKPLYDLKTVNGQKVVIKLFNPAIYDLKDQTVLAKSSGKTYRADIPSSLLGDKSNITIYVFAHTKITQHIPTVDKDGKPIVKVLTTPSEESYKAIRMQRIGLTDLD